MVMSPVRESDFKFSSFVIDRESLRRVESLKVAKAEALSGDVEDPLDASSVVTSEEGVVLPDDLVARMGR